MIKLVFTLSGSPVATLSSEVVPHTGSEVILRTDSYKKGLVPGSLIRFTVEGEHCDPVAFDLTDNEAVVHFDINGYDLLEAGPPLED